MTHAACMKLNSFDTGIHGDALSIDIRIDISFHNSDLEASLQLIDESGKQSGFSASGRRHNINKKGFLGLHLLSEFIGINLILSKNTLLDFNNSDVFIHEFSFNNDTLV